MRRRKPSRRRRDEASINSAHSTAATVVDDRPLSSINIPTTPTRARALERGVSSDQPSPSRRRYLYRRAPPNIVARDTSQDVISRVDARHRARRSRGNFNRAHRAVDRRSTARASDRSIVQPSNALRQPTSLPTSLPPSLPAPRAHRGMKITSRAFEKNAKGWIKVRARSRHRARPRDAMAPSRSSRASRRARAGRDEDED